jgi:undecaprenyl-diphosphatase
MLQASGKTARAHYMRNLFWSLVWRLHHWDIALSHRIALKQGLHNQNAHLYRPALISAHLGDSWLWAIVAGYWLKVAYARRSEDGGAGTRLVLTWLSSVIASIGLTLMIKQRVQRTRPGQGHLLYGAGADIHSFPSGHAARLSTIAIWASSLAPGWGVLVWSLAILVGWSRVALGIHYVGDVVAGGLLGSAVGLIFRWGWRRKADRLTR